MPVEIYLGRGRAEGRGLLSSISLLSAFLLTGIKRNQAKRRQWFPIPGSQHATGNAGFGDVDMAQHGAR